MELNMDMLGRILHAVANELQNIEQEKLQQITVVEENKEPVIEEEDLSRFCDVATALPPIQVQETQPPVPEIPKQDQPSAVDVANIRIAQLEEQLRDERRQNSMANFNFQPININGDK